MINTDGINTEKRNPNTTHIDRLPTLEMVSLMHSESRRAYDAVTEILPQIAEAVDKIADGFEHGGHLYYIGAGTSGRLGVLDASECPPTFGVDDGLVVGIIAGGDRALRKSSEGAEDSYDDGYNEIKNRSLGQHDVLVGIAASGRTPYVLGAMAAAKEAGATVCSISSTPGSKLDEAADIRMSADTGPEVVTGSTRLKSGTAQKLILNMLSTCSMIKTGRVYENLMICVRPTNEKLKARCANITSQIIGVDFDEAYRILSLHDFDIKAVIDEYKK
ncbi:MAG: N-acetylmuramic acid 6-phosphate etherase [Clostridia bacterium]|nr:N-acetylmuramic acid 6-phosphate etherase [Clostridia bacterium]